MNQCSGCVYQARKQNDLWHLFYEMLYTEKSSGLRHLMRGQFTSRDEAERHLVETFGRCTDQLEADRVSCLVLLIPREQEWDLQVKWDPVPTTSMLCYPNIANLKYKITKHAAQPDLLQLMHDILGDNQ